MSRRVTKTGTDDRDESGKDDFEQRMAGVSRLPGRDRLVEDTVVKARHGVAVRERRAGSARRGSRIEIGSVAGLKRRQADALRGGGIEIDARLDLHGLSRREAAGKVAEFLAQSARHGLRCVLVITGQGRRDPLAEARGVLRMELEGWLNVPSTRSFVLACVPAQRRHGGEGAFYVLLRRSRGAEHPLPLQP
jgi:DNA-nicking Smr family endonuclease